MENKQDHGQLCSVFMNTLFLVRTFLSEFESIFDNKSIKKDYPKIEIVYMQIIIVNLAKLFSKLKCDKFGIIQLKNISPKKIKVKIEEIEKSYKGTIGKILTNRNKLIAHTDKYYYRLPFSDNEIKSVEENIKASTRISEKEVEDIFSRMNRATNKDEEIYTPKDLKNDSAEIKNIIEQLDKIWLEVLIFNNLAASKKLGK